MRPVLVLFLLISTTGTLSAEAPPKSSESDLARAYYQAAKANDFGEANAAYQELMDRFSDDDLTKLVGDHWNRRLKEEDPKSWKNISVARAKSLRKNALVTVVYQVADMVVPVSSNGNAQQETDTTAKAFTKLISETLDHLADKEGEQKCDCKVTFHQSTLSMVIHAPQSIHTKLETVLNQMRRQQDPQILFEVNIVSVPAKIANTWGIGETWTRNVLKRRIRSASEDEGFKILMSPTLVTLGGKSTSIKTETVQVSLRGSVTKDQQAVRTEMSLSENGDAKVIHWFPTASEVIPEGRTCVFFIRSEDALSRGLDRRLLIEKGIDVAPSTASQLFALITPKIIVLEEEELLGLPEESTSTTETSSPRSPVQGWRSYTPSLPAYGSKYPSSPHSPGWPSVKPGWDSVKLNWDDKSWNLNFDTDSKNTQNAIDAWDLNWPSQAIRYRKEAEKRIPDINPLPKRRR